MRRPLLARFAIVSFIGLSALVVACAKTEDPDLTPVADTEKTEPEADAGKKLPPKTQVLTPPKASVPDAAPPVVDAAPPAEPEEPEEPEPPECPQDEAHSTAALLASMMGGTACPGGGADCSQGECCMVNMFSPSANFCVPE